MSDRWATFDCYGTLIDWEGGIASALGGLWPEVGRELLLADYHAVEPRVQADRNLSYREVLGRATAAVAAIEGWRSLRDARTPWPPRCPAGPRSPRCRRR